MPVRLALLLALAFGAFVAYLAAVNPTSVRVTLGPNLVYELPLMALVVGAFLAGACLSLLFVLVRDLGRSVREYRLARRAVTRAEIHREGSEAPLAQASGDREVPGPYQPEPLRSEEHAATLMALAEDYERTGRVDDALATYQRILEPDRDSLTALRAIRGLAASAGRWAEALEVQQRLVALAGAGKRSAELGWLAGVHYEIGKTCLAKANFAEARRHFTEALKADRAFLPASLALGDAWEQAGDRREALRTWKRAAEEIAPGPVLLRRMEQVYRAEGRPTQMIALYQEALTRAPQDLALAFSLGRVYFELEMLDEAADQFQKVEVRAPDLASLHAFLGAIYERRGQVAEAFEEYRRARRLSSSFEWPHRCSVCGADHTGWQDRCPHCGRWNTSRG